MRMITTSAPRIRRSFRTAALGGLAALFLCSAAAPAQQYTIKFATVAPDGSPWMNVMHEFDRQIRKESGGRLGFKIYPNNIQGDEKDVLRKIRLGQLQGAGITGVGMTTISPMLRILDSPFLFKSSDEVDAIHKEFDGEFNKAFEENGFVNLGWAEVGFIYVFTNTPVRTPDDMKNVRMWMWEGDPIARAAFAAIALQWFPRAKYMLDAPLANATGAVVLSRKEFDKLPPDLREILVRNGTVYMKKLTQVSREENVKSIETLKKNGITVVEPPSPQARAMYDEIGSKARLLAGKLYSRELLDRVERSLAAYREHPHKGSE